MTPRAGSCPGAARASVGRPGWTALVLAAVLGLACHRPAPPDSRSSLYRRLSTFCAQQHGTCEVAARDFAPGDWDTLWIGNGVYDDMFKDMGSLSSDDRRRLIEDSRRLVRSYNLVMVTHSGEVEWSEWCEADEDADVPCVHAGETPFHGWLVVPRSGLLSVEKLQEHDLVVTVVSSAK